MVYGLEVDGSNCRALHYLTPMTKAQDRKATKAGLNVKKCRRGVVYSDPITGKSFFNGNRSRKSFRHERRLGAFLRDSGLD